MKRAVGPAILALVCATLACAQTDSLTSTPVPQAEKRSWFGRLIHRDPSPAAPTYKDTRLRGLLLNIELSPQPVKLSEVRQLEVRVTLTNLSKRGIELDFPTDQRIEIVLRNTDEKVLTRWSENHAVAQKFGTVLINPQEHIEYNETIATRELTPNRVFITEVFFPEFPELNARQKFLTAP